MGYFHENAETKMYDGKVFFPLTCSKMQRRYGERIRPEAEGKNLDLSITNHDFIRQHEHGTN